MAPKVEGVKKPKKKLSKHIIVMKHYWLVSTYPMIE